MKADTNKVADASNKTVAGTGSYNISGFKRYENSGEMIADKANNETILATFDGNLWDTSTGVPVWHSLVDYELSINDGDASVEIGAGDSEGVELSIKLNGVAISNATLSIVEGADVIEIREGKIYPVKMGDATVKASVTKGNREITDTIVINVGKTTTTYADTVELFSATDGVSMGTKSFASILTEEFGAEEFTLTQGETALEYSSGVVIGVKESLIKDSTGYVTGVNTITITATGESKVVNFNVNAYTKVIDSASDLEMFTLNFEGLTGNEAGTVTDKTGAVIANKTVIVYADESTPFDGYYILSNNIDASAYTHPSHGYAPASLSYQDQNVYVYDADTNTQQAYNASNFYGLIGTFDGNGYTIKGMTVANGGLFGSIGHTGIVKNVAFTNVDLITSYARSALSARISSGAMLTNIYMHAETLENGSLFARSICSGVIMENCVIELTKMTGGSGVLFAEDQAKDDVSTWKNNFVISPVKLYESSTKTVDGSNQTVTTGYTLGGFKRYDDSAAMIADAANNTEALAKFDSNLWDTSTGVPVWKTLA